MYFVRETTNGKIGFCGAYALEASAKKAAQDKTKRKIKWQKTDCRQVGTDGSRIFVLEGTGPDAECE